VCAELSARRRHVAQQYCGCRSLRESSGPSLPCHRATHRRRAPGVNDTWAGAAPSIGRNTDVSRSVRPAAGGRALLWETRLHGVGSIEGRGPGAGLSETCRSLPAVSAGIRTCRGNAGRPGPKMGSCADGAGHRPEDSGAAAALTGTGDPVARPHRHPVPRTPAGASTRRGEATACSISRHGLLHRRRSLAGPRAACGRHDGAQATASMDGVSDGALVTSQ